MEFTQHQESEVIWKANTDPGFLVKDWSKDEVAVYNKSSGNTHLLDSRANQILNYLITNARSITDLTKDFAKEISEDGYDDPAQYIGKVIEELSYSDLVEPVK